MINIKFKREITIFFIFLFLIPSFNSVFGFNNSSSFTDTSIKINIDQVKSEIKNIVLEFDFDDLQLIEDDEYIIIRVNGTNINSMVPGNPVLPANLTVLNLPFGSEILDINLFHPDPIIFNISKKLALGNYPNIDDFDKYSVMDRRDLIIFDINDSYPSNWTSYHTGGGLAYGDHKTFFVLRVYPVKYLPKQDQLHFINNITVNIVYSEPIDLLINDTKIYDLLILTPDKYLKLLTPLVDHKEKFGIETRIVTLEEVYAEMYWQGRDDQEKIKYFIKYAIENWGVINVLLIGGIKGQTFYWDMPVRYSRVVPPDEQEYPEQSFISDLYFADIYDSQGEFSSWDSNDDNIFSVWNETYKDNMDLYPDVYLGRLPCRTKSEVQVMVNKIINYENEDSESNWFYNLILVAGDSYNDKNHFNEGELICERAVELMPGFNPVKVYTSEQDINRDTVNKAINPGAGFAYFCGHGSTMTWNTHYPPDGIEWCTGYEVQDMMFLRNGYKLPITIVGGCHNGQFDTTMANIIQGFLDDGFHYFSSRPGNAGQFWYGEWTPNCWGWWLTSKIGGGSIATIANTGLGTHGDGDVDKNEIADYLEVLDGWMELRFLELYGVNNKEYLGENHGQTLTEYLHRFMGDNAKMDTKMVQQWELFGDPILKIGGYN